MKYLIYIFIVVMIGVSWAIIITGVIDKIPSRQFTITPEEEPIKIEVELIGWREVTAYSSTVDQCDDTPFITASGKAVGYGIIACPRHFPFGTKVLIENKVYTCEDRMHKDYVNRFDIWFSSREDAAQWGIKTLEISIVTIYE